MKTRNGFVSNSSSSSFLIAVLKDNKPCPHCGRKDLDFLDMVEHSYNSNNHVNEIIGSGDISKYIEREYGYLGRDDYDNLLSMAELNAKNPNCIIVNITLSDHDENIHKVLKDLVSLGAIGMLFDPNN